GRRGLGELRPELAEAQVLAATLDEREGGRVPERGRAAVAEHDLVALRQAEELAEARAHPAHELLDRLLPVRGAEQLRMGLKVGELLGPDLRRPAAETSVGREQ